MLPLKELHLVWYIPVHELKHGQSIDTTADRDDCAHRQPTSQLGNTLAGRVPRSQQERRR